MFFETVLVLILSIAFWIVKFLDCYEPTWANLSQLEPTCGPKWPNGAAHAHAYCIIRAGNGNCWASVSATINLYFKHVTCSQDTFKMASSTQTRKIHVPIGLWIFMVIIVRTAGRQLHAIVCKAQQELSHNLLESLYDIEDKLGDLLLQSQPTDVDVWSVSKK